MTRDGARTPRTSPTIPADVPGTPLTLPEVAELLHVDPQELEHTLAHDPNAPATGEQSRYPYAAVYAWWTSRPDHPDTVPDWPLGVAAIARHLHVPKDVLWRALRADPSAPGPVHTDEHTGVLSYTYRSVHAWWPQRRRRGHRGADLAPRKRRSQRQLPDA